MRMIRTITTLAAVIALTLPAQAGDLSPVGTWQTTTGESRFQVSLCGDGTELCARLTWLRADARTPDNLALLNKLVMRQAKAVDENQWRGEVQFDGQTLLGSVKLISANKMELSGCKLIACKSVDFVRI